MVKQRERGSAQRLQLDRIPLYQVHQPNPVIPDSVDHAGHAACSTAAPSGRAGAPN
jgi:aryl-alcohol dehydrogenase-like predicted oxidoreductase